MHNAADARISSQNINLLKTPAALSSMFSETNPPCRASQSLKKYDPTDAQAEVLVFDAIPPEAIFGVALISQAVQAQYAHLLGERRAYNHGGVGFFDNRSYARGRGF